MAPLPVLGYNDGMTALYLLRPKVRSIVNHVASRPKLPGLVILVLTVGFLVGIHVLVVKILSMMDQVPLIGLVLKNFLLSAVLLCLLFMLTFSNLINALSAFFLSDELELVFAAPLPYRTVFCSKFCEVALRSSWMFFLVLAPVMTAYGVSYDGTPLFFVVWLPLVVPFVATCTALGVVGALVLAAVVPVRRAATALQFVFVVGAGILIVLVRMLQPEQLVDPERFESFGRFLLSLHGPVTTDLPSYWLSRILLCFIKLDFFAIDRFALRYLATAAAACLFAYGLACRLHENGWRRFLVGGGRPASSESSARHPLWRRKAAVLGRLLVKDAATRRLVEKEWLLFLRTPAIWTQTALLLVIVVIYVYNLHLLPAASLAELRSDLPAIMAFCNVAFIACIVTAAALRFGFPAVSMEGRALRLIAASPVPPEDYLAVKFWSSAVPLVGLAATLAAASALMLETDGVVAVVVAIDAVVLALAIAALALFFGTVYADLRAQNVAEIPSGWGGMLFMVAAVVMTAAFLAVQAYPCYWYFLLTTSVLRPSAAQQMAIVGCLLGSLVLTAATTAWARRLSRRWLLELV